MLELTSLLRRLETSPLADWVGGPIYPIVSALHIVGLAFVIVPVFLADVRIISLGCADDRAKWLSRIALAGFLGATFTGSLLFSVQATRYADNPAIAFKLALLSFAGINALCFYGLSGLRRALAASSVIVWCGVLLSGRWIAFAW